MGRQIASFMLEDTILGIDILLVKEVYRKVTLTPIPDSPDLFRGLMNLRGRVVTVIDLNVCLNRPQVEKDLNESRLLILKTDEEIIPYQKAGLLTDKKLSEDIVGLLIDRMDDVLTVNDEDISSPPPNLAAVEEELIEGVIKIGEKILILLDIDAILERVMSAIPEMA